MITRCKGWPPGTPVHTCHKYLFDGKMNSHMENERKTDDNRTE